MYSKRGLLNKEYLRKKPVEPGQIPPRIHCTYATLP